MKIDIINTGSELMLGRVLNTHQQWLCRQLADIGYVVERQVAIADTAADIQSAVRESLGRADLIITTGGLGPTSDDLTRDLVAGLLDRKLHVDEEALANIRAFFGRRNRPMPESTQVQALVPDGSIVLQNSHGTAPGLAIQLTPNPYRVGGTSTWLIMLPGPPRELHPMFRTQVIPLLQQQLPLEAAYVCRTLRTTGIGESWAEERISGPLAHLVTAGLDLGYCARTGEVDIRLASSGCGAQETVTEAESIVRKELGTHIFAEDDESLESVIVRILTDRNKTLALAESCTGGYVANRITNVPGASAVLLAGVVSYSNAAKHALLGVREETLLKHGAVSEATAREMAEGARKVTGADYAIGITGIAGPSGSTEAKPVGTVFIALASAEKTEVLNPINRYDRETFKYVTSQQSLEMLRRCVLNP